MIKRQHPATPDAQIGDDNAALLPMRTVAALTGIKVGTLRIWELGYHLLTPVRTDTGHRSHTQRDVAKLNEVQRLHDCGIRICQVSAHLAERRRTRVRRRRHRRQHRSAARLGHHSRKIK